MAFSTLDLKTRSRRLVCASGDTRFFNVSGNKLAYVTEIEVDDSARSGQVAVTTIQLLDAYVPATTGTATTSQVIRKQTAVRAGEVIAVTIEGGAQFFGGLDVRVSSSGPIVTLHAIIK